MFGLDETHTLARAPAGAVLMAATWSIAGTAAHLQRKTIQLVALAQSLLHGSWQASLDRALTDTNDTGCWRFPLHTSDKTRQETHSGRKALGCHSSKGEYAHSMHMCDAPLKHCTHATGIDTNIVKATLRFTLQPHTALIRHITRSLYHQD